MKLIISFFVPWEPLSCVDTVINPRIGIHCLVQGARKNNQNQPFVSANRPSVVPGQFGKVQKSNKCFPTRRASISTCHCGNWQNMPL